MNIINSNLQFNGLTYGNNPDMIILHHAEASQCTVQDIHAWHLANGWAGIGYHYFVRKDGSIYTGRPENAIGSHCLHYNAHSIGICAEGEYMKEQMPVVQKQALIELGAYIKNKYGIKIVGGHKEYYQTDCPGINYPLEEIKTDILGGSATPAATAQSAPAPTVVNVSDTTKTIQQQLNTLLKKGLVADGILGPNTTVAIRDFQGIMGLVSDGIWGPKTVAAVEQIYSRPTDSVPAAHYEYATRYIQFRVGAGVDGGFGNQTKVAVQNWQARHGLTPDGVVGGATWSKLLDENV